MTEENGEAKTESGRKGSLQREDTATTKKTHHKDWLAVGGIGLEKRRRSSQASYRIENNKVSRTIKFFLYVLLTCFLCFMIAVIVSLDNIMLEIFLDFLGCFKNVCS